MKRQYKYEESDTQIECVQWCDYYFNARHRDFLMKVEDKNGRITEVAPLVHCPNHQGKNVRATMRLRRMGQKSGFPDLELQIARGGYRGLFIEMKSNTGRLSANQKHNRNYLEKQGKWVLCRTLGEFQDAVIDYMGLE